jgi:putative CocE/NonD family hydrolase
MRLTETRCLGPAVAVTAVCLVLPATPVAGQQTFTIDDAVMVEMTDGTKLAATVYLPQAPGKHPAVLVRTPYSRSQLGGYVAEPLAEHGFAVVMQDVRGMGGSEGLFIPFIHEKADGLDTLDWVADQPWCNGRIGIWGPSYVGFCGLVLAPEDHPNLKAIVNVSGWGDTQEMVSPGGAMHFMPARRARRVVGGPDEEETRCGWA